MSLYNKQFRKCDNNDQRLWNETLPSLRTRVIPRSIKYFEVTRADQIFECLICGLRIAHWSSKVKVFYEMAIQILYFVNPFNEENANCDSELLTLIIVSYHLGLFVMELRFSHWKLYFFELLNVIRESFHFSAVLLWITIKKCLIFLKNIRNDWIVIGNHFDVKNFNNLLIIFWTHSFLLRKTSLNFRNLKYLIHDFGSLSILFFITLNFKRFRL